MLRGCPAAQWSMQAGPASREAAAVQFRMATRGDPRIAQPPPDSITHGTLACSHLTAAIGQVLLKGPAPADKDIAKWVAGGRWCPEAVAAHDSVFGDVLKTGLPYLVIDWRVRVLCPRALELISEALNTYQAAAMCDAEHSIMPKLLAMAANDKAAGIPENWGKYMSIVFAPGPPCKDVQSELTAFVAKCSGANGMHLRCLCNWWTREHPQTRLAADVYIQAREAWYVKHPRIAIGMVKAIINTSTVQHGATINAREVTTKFKKAAAKDAEDSDLLESAERVLVAARAGLGGVPLDQFVDAGLSRLLGELDVSVALLLLNRALPHALASRLADANSGTVRQKVVACFRRFRTDLTAYGCSQGGQAQAATGGESSAWDLVALNEKLKEATDAADKHAASQAKDEAEDEDNDKAKRSQKAKPKAAVRKGSGSQSEAELTLDTRGDDGSNTAAGTLFAKGFVAGADAHCRTECPSIGVSGPVYGDVKVETIAEEGVTVVHQDGRCFTIAVGEFIKHFWAGTWKASGEQRCMPKWPGDRLRSDKLAVEALKGSVHSALYMLRSRVDEMLADQSALCMFELPSRSVGIPREGGPVEEAEDGTDGGGAPEKKRKTASKAGEIVLTPDTCSVSFRRGRCSGDADFMDSTGRPPAGPSGPRRRRQGPPEGARGHQLRWSRGAWRCALCGKYARSDKNKQELRRRACPGKIRIWRPWGAVLGRGDGEGNISPALRGQALGHDLYRSGDFIFCDRCGVYSSRRVCKLAVPCTLLPAGPMGKWRLSRLRRCKHPQNARLSLGGACCSLVREECDAFWARALD